MLWHPFPVSGCPGMKNWDWTGNKMYIIVGLGNPGRQYEGTRHNIGFQVIDEIAAKHHIGVAEKKHKALVGKGMIQGEKVILVKPQTFMNLSGESVRSVIDYYKIDETAELILILDDVSLQSGQLRIRKKGSAGGHNGLKNVILHLNHDEFMRIRIGIGEKPSGYDLADYVLGHFAKEEEESVLRSIKDASEAVEVLLTDGMDKAMNRFNKKVNKEEQ